MRSGSEIIPRNLLLRKNMNHCVKAYTDNVYLSKEVGINFIASDQELVGLLSTRIL